MKPLSSLSVVCLAYNEEENARWAMPQLLSLLDQVTDDGEIVVVTHPNSRDGTNAYLEELRAKDKRVRPVHQPAGTKGYGQAFAFGIKQASKEYIFHVDIDGQFRFEELQRAIQVMKETGADWVHFNRKGRKDPLERKIIGLGFKILVHGLYRCPAWDFDSAFNLLKSSLVRDIEFESRSGLAVPELMIRVGKTPAKIVVGETEHQPRRAGKPLWEVRSKLVPIILPNFDIVKGNLKDLWRLRKSLGSRF